MPKFYFYKMTVDDGGAPCVQNGLLSLAICKPMIRSVASEGDILLGFATNELGGDNRLVYAAKVTQKLGGKDYYSGQKYSGRADCIYSWNEGSHVRKVHAKFHGNLGDLRHDLGQPPDYKRAWVLLSNGLENFRHFGTGRPEDYKKNNPYLKSEIESLTQGHRVNHDPALRRELERLGERVFAMPFTAATVPVRASGKKCHDCSAQDSFTECA